MRKVALLPIAVFTLIVLLLIVSAIPLLAGEKDAGQPPTRGGFRAAHRVSGHWFVVLMWLVLPLCATIPLCVSWRNLRRKWLAVFSMAIAVLGAVAFTLLMSSTGYLIHVSGDDVAMSARIRMKALHVLGFPILLMVALSVMWAITLRLARRMAQGGREGPGQGAPRPASLD